MKCPYCGVHYLDSEHECPVCGNRPGIGAPKKKSKFTAQDSSDQPAREKNSSAKKILHQPASSDAAWQRAAAQNSGASPKQPGEARTSGCAPGCLIVAIILILLTIVPAVMSYVTFSDFSGAVTFVDDDSELYEPCALDEVLSAGTWTNDDGSLRITVYDDGSIAWTDGIRTAQDPAPSFERMLLTEDTASESCSREELEQYPVEDYTHYTLYFSDSSSNLPDYDLYIYVPNDTAPEDVTSFGCFDWESDEFFTLTRIDQSEVPAMPVSQST
ncbi:hypothetical protein [Butyricicoccus porcorum]|uniref:hypothetical protein n=1 Tax=Butyricicoccus porcorum TaxID=1945634 RepID=UPI003F4ACA7C